MPYKMQKWNFRENLLDKSKQIAMYRTKSSINKWGKVNSGWPMWQSCIEEMIGNNEARKCVESESVNHGSGCAIEWNLSCARKIICVGWCKSGDELAWSWSGWRWRCPSSRWWWWRWRCPSNGPRCCLQRGWGSGRRVEPSLTRMPPAAFSSSRQQILSGGIK